MAEPYLGQIIMFGGNFPIRGFATCDGQTLPISQNSALFSILGTTYGGDGRTNFKLPDLRGRFPTHFGSGPGLPERRIGSSGGRNNHQLTIGNLPAHNHGVRVRASDNDPESDESNNSYMARQEEDFYNETFTDGKFMGDVFKTILVAINRLVLKTRF